MIILENITKSYFLPRRELQILKEISLEIKKGEFISVMGPSGSGKSTLLNIIGCLDRPTSGRYLLENTDVSGNSDDELAEIRNKKIGFVFQQYNLIPRIPAMSNVELPLLYAGVKTDERKKKALEYLEKVGLSERANHMPNELSGGEQQRVSIARALINNPSLILADEPTGNLDTKSSMEIMDIFKSIHKEGTTIVMVTHEPDISEKAERIIRMRDGKILNGHI